jgi:hypothetical protein
MLRISAEERIERARAEAFRFVASEHFVNLPRGDPDLVEMEQASPVSGRPGRRRAWCGGRGGRTIEGVAEVTAYEPDRLASWDVRFGSFRLVQRAEFIAQSPAATMLRLTIETHARGPLRFVLALMRRGLRGTSAGAMTSP